MSSLKEMRSALRKLRSEHSGKAVGKMNAEEIAKEIMHHEDACKHREMREKRMNALKKAHEARKAKKEPKKEEPKKQTEKDKEDEKLGEEIETIKSRKMRGKKKD